MEAALASCDDGPSPDPQTSFLPRSLRGLRRPETAPSARLGGSAPLARHFAVFSARRDGSEYLADLRVSLDSATHGKNDGPLEVGPRAAHLLRVSRTHPLKE